MCLDLAAHLDMRGHLALGAVKPPDHGFLHDLHALPGEGFPGKGRNLGIFHRQDALHHLDHGRLGAERVVETGKFDPDGPRADDQQFPGHPGRHQRVLVGPDAIAVGLQPRQFARARAGG